MFVDIQSIFPFCPDIVCSPGGAGGDQLLPELTAGFILGSNTRHEWRRVPRVGGRSATGG